MIDIEVKIKTLANYVCMWYNEAKYRYGEPIINHDHDSRVMYRAEMESYGKVIEKMLELKLINMEDIKTAYNVFKY